MKGREFQQTPCTRRTVLKVGAGIAGCLSCGGLTGCGEATLDEPFTVAFGDYPALSEVGGVATIGSADSGFKFPIYMVRLADDDYVAYSSECTHFGCEIELVSFAAGYECPCHGSQFDIEGRVTNGPAGQDLVHFDLEWDEESITVSPSE